ncbi:ABC transporter substrate-binding protein [Neomegalonema perideroedes]|uniref:ABC transporter substrate-binding protein n=1 Tax=Neomegalonema perideroedes TaxID=217219 RepID=UPI0003754DFB|nr:ABC transporter substrate-binding protein [Neomegalonema perideroedes]
MIRRRSLIGSVLLAASSLVSLPFGAAMAQERPLVAVSQIVEHPALDAARRGLIDGLDAAGYRAGDTIRFSYQTAQGNPAVAAQIARQFVGENPAVLVGIATPTAQALAAATQDIPIVFTAVTDPVDAKLIASFAKPGGNVTGLSDMSPVTDHVKLIREILPEAKTIGVVYNPGEANAVSLLAALKAAAPGEGFTVIEASAARTSEVQSAAQGLGPRVDVIYAPTDNTVASAIAALVNGAKASDTPVIGGETSFVEAGAVAALGFDYYQVGVQTADYVVEILKGRKPADLPARVAVGTDLKVNLEAAKALGITFSEELLARVTPDAPAEPAAEEAEEAPAEAAE